MTHAPTSADFVAEAEALKAHRRLTLERLYLLLLLAEERLGNRPRSVAVHRGWLRFMESEAPCRPRGSVLTVFAPWGKVRVKGLPEHA